MARKSWTVETGESTHEVTLDWGYWGGRRVVEVDGEVVDEDTKPMRWKSEQTFPLDGHEVTVRTRPSMPGSAMFIVELELDGKIVASHDKKGDWESAKSV